MSENVILSVLLKRNEVANAIRIFLLVVFISFFFDGMTKERENLSWKILNGLEPRAFVENNGQFSSTKTGFSYYMAHLNGANVYFTKQGLVFEYIVPNSKEFHSFLKHESEECEEALKNGGAKHMEDEESFRFFDKKTLRLDFINADTSNIKISAFGKIEHYYNYGFISKEGKAENIRADLFKRIMYKNIYPGIDAEFFFHPDSGLKYNFIVNPGADIKRIKLKWGRSAKITIDDQGQIRIKSAFALLMDRKPVTFYENSNEFISSAWEQKGNLLTFSLGHYDSSRKLIIDPWLTNINFLGANHHKLWDLSIDANGNVYALGSIANMKLIKISPAGNVLWTYVTPYFNNNWRGDLITDNAGITYLSNGASNINASKISTNGTLMLTGAGFPMHELFRFAFNPPKTNLVATHAMGTQGLKPINMNTMVDGPLSNGASTGSHETRALCGSPNGNFYGLSCNANTGTWPPPLTQPSGSVTAYDQNLNMLWSVNGGYATIHYNGPAYAGIPHWSAPFNDTPGGINGIIASNCSVYTYDGSLLKKWRASDGLFISSVIVPNGVAGLNSGMAIDQCENVFVGTGTGVVKYDKNLVFQTTVNTPNAVYDLGINSFNNELVCCGNSFAASFANLISLNCPPVTSSTSFTNAGCNACNGVASYSVVNLTTPITYSWSNGVVQANSTLTISTITGLCPGNYTVIASACNGTNTATVQVTGASGSLTFSVSPVQVLNCQTGSVVLTATANLSGPLTYSWSGNGIVGATNTSSVTVNQAGNYSVTLSMGACVSTSIVTVTQNTVLPNINIAPFGTLTCTTPSLMLNGSSTTNGVVYNWQPQNANTANLPVNTAGIYTLTVTDLVNGCFTNSVVSVSQNTLQPNLSPLPSGTLTCTTPTIMLTGTSTTGGATFNWQPQNVSTSSVQITAAGIYTLTVTDPDNGCSISTTAAVIQNTAVVNLSVAPFGTLTCTTPSLILNGSSSINGVTYNWQPQNVNTPTVQVTAAGIYTLLATDPGNGCSASTMVTVSQNTIDVNISVAPFGTLTCTYPSLVLSGNSTTGGVTYSWQPQNVNTTTVMVNAAGTYTLIVTDPMTGCSTTSIVSVSQNTTQPDVSIVSSGSLSCSSTSSVVLTGTSSVAGLNYQWLSGPPGNTYSVGVSGSYTLQGTDVSNGCLATAVFLIPTVSTFSAGIGVLNHQKCHSDKNGALQITHHSGGVPPYSISIVGGNVTMNGITGFPVTLNNLSAGNYIVHVTDSKGCKQILTASIQQPALLLVALSGSAVVCKGMSTILLSTVAGGVSPYSYNWSPINATTQNVLVSPDVTTDYTLQVTDANNCKATATFSIDVKPAPVVNLLDKDVKVCLPVCKTFSLAQNQQPGYVYDWRIESFAPAYNSISASGYRPHICFSKPGVYSLSVTVTSGSGCSTKRVYGNLVAALIKPVANFYYLPEDIDVLSSPTASFVNTSQYSTAQYWSFSNSFSSVTSALSYSFSSAGNYMVSLIASNESCTDTLTKEIRVNDAISIYVPNTFTPNDDGLNDGFYPVITGYFQEKDYSFEVYNRWGQLVFSSKAIYETKWNGYYKEEKCKTDVYTWKLNVTDGKGRAYEKTGHVNILE
ncbi:MAG: gliding motility-associated C-terminal domain-containing protein [Sediminibacterium sp.]|nr:gliding motility-associated C-terminal domain-containing protein [Sediminibacterium sp.]